MLIAERGGIRNLGLSAENPFAFPHEARALRYELDQPAGWQPVGRYDVGFYDRGTTGRRIARQLRGRHRLRLGYTAASRASTLTKPDQFVWITGDSLCSPEGPCRSRPVRAPRQRRRRSLPRHNSPPRITRMATNAEVHGSAGAGGRGLRQLDAAGGLAPYPPNGSPYPPIGPDKTYLIDADINVDAAGKPIEAEFCPQRRDQDRRRRDLRDLPTAPAVCVPPASGTRRRPADPVRT